MAIPTLPTSRKVQKGFAFGQINKIVVCEHVTFISCKQRMSPKGDRLLIGLRWTYANRRTF